MILEKFKIYVIRLRDIFILCSLTFGLMECIFYCYVQEKEKLSNKSKFSLKP